MGAQARRPAQRAVLAARQTAAALAGRGWALSEAVCDPLFEYDLVETHGLNTVRTDVVPHCLSREVRSALARQRPNGWDGAQDFNLVHVGAGMRIWSTVKPSHAAGKCLDHWSRNATLRPLVVQENCSFEPRQEFAFQTAP